MNTHPPTGRHGLEQIRAQLAGRAAHPAATITVLDGHAEIHEPTTRRWHPAVQGAVLSTGQRIRVGAGRAMVRLSDGSDVWMAAGAELDLSAWGAASRAITLAAGHILALVARAAGAPFRTISAHGEILVTGTAFEARAGAGELAVNVLHGSIRLDGAAGRMPVRAGRAATVRPAGAPAACARTAHAWGGFGPIDASARNPGIAPAYRAARRHLDPSKGNPIMRKRNIVVAAAVVAGLFALLAWRAPEVLGIEQSGMRILYVDKDGRERRIDGSSRAALEASLADVPKQQADVIRESYERQQRDAELMRSRYGAFAGGGGEIVVRETFDPNDPWEQLIGREQETALKSFKDMVAKGVDPEKARAAVERAFEDSVRVQRKHMPGFEDAKVQARASIVGDGTDARLKFEISTSRTSAKDAPPGMPEELKDAALRAHEAIDEDADPKSPLPNPADYLPKN